MMKNLKIKTKLLVVFITIILMAYFSNLFGIDAIKSVKDYTVKMYNHPFAVSNAVRDAEINILKIHREMKDISTASSNTQIKESIKYVDEYQQLVYENFDIINERFLGDKTMVNEALDAFKNWKPIRDEVIQLTMAEKKDAAISITKGKGAEQVNLLNKKIKVLDDFAQNKAKEFFNNVNEENNKFIIVLLIIFGITFLISMLLAFMIIKSITSGLSKLTLMITDLLEGDGDLTKRLEINSKDELGDVSKLLNLFVSKIHSLVSIVKDTSENIDNQSQNLSTVSEGMLYSAENVASAIQNIAEGTGEQAEDLSNISSIVNQFSENLNNNLYLLNDIDASAKEVQLMVDNSDNEMHTLIESVNKSTNSFKDFAAQILILGEDINKINEITNVINNISDQTNLLALNASIEAARAGEAGKGFAVVAEEIRKLAEQSKSSSKSINSLISSISKDTNTMLKTTDEMDNELNNQAEVINTTINSFKKIIIEVDEIIPKIEAVNMNAAGITDEKNTILEKVESTSSVAEEVSASCEEIAALSQEMNASTEEVTSVAQTLNNMTTDMIKQLNKFKV